MNAGIAVDIILYVCAALFVLTTYLSYKEFIKPKVWELEKVGSEKEIKNNKTIETSEAISSSKDDKNEEGLRNRKPIVDNREGFKVIYESNKKMRIEEKTAKPLLTTWYLINLALFTFVLDLSFSPIFKSEENLTFARLGHVGPNSAKVFFRIPPHALNVTIDEEFDYSVLKKEKIIIKHSEIQFKGQGAYKNQLNWISEYEHDFPSQNDDFTGYHELTSLKPSSLYYTEIFIKNMPNSIAGIELKTAPATDSPTMLTFGTGSCIKPNFPYFPGSAPHISGFRQMAKHSLDFIMFLGDFIYADCPFYYGSSLEEYRRLYRQVYTAEDTKNLVTKTPMYHIYDDHEIVDNWDKTQNPPYGNAIKAYWEYNGSPNPVTDINNNAFYYNFTYGNIAFYVFDTRGHRDNEEKPDSPEKTMLGAKQKAHFMNWLKETNHTAAVKFVVSSVPLAYVWNSGDAKKDTWRGYKYERASILSETKYVPNLFFLSGDRHEVAVVRLASDNYEFSNSPINQFSLPLVNDHIDGWGGDITEYYQQPGQTKYGVLSVDTKTNEDIPKVTYSLYTNVDHGAEKPAYVFEAECVEWK
ncbi:Alkaline phosphatase D [Smittium culicis]|uniref:Alkaline phosphatase D n=1 Tax=Smittium culicis TaxID=133412 RepID=A0A1R1YD74_9FUNG|nr:Alkaline phosphatase D [Smittium culicis]